MHSKVREITILLIFVDFMSLIRDGLHFFLDSTTRSTTQSHALQKLFAQEMKQNFQSADLASFPIPQYIHRFQFLTADLVNVDG